MQSTDTTPLLSSEEIFRPHAHGLSYLGFIRGLTRGLGAKRYLEIGTRKGGSLSVVDCQSIAVDPEFALSHEVVGSKELCMMFQMTSDDFFARYDVLEFFPSGVDVAFLDGMHRFEFLLRDFMNTEKVARRNSVILMHDCLPTSPGIAMRERRHEQPISDASSRRFDESSAGAWAGDVWKVVSILQELRPELELHCLDCPPTGLVLITGLDPSSTVLDDRYFDVVARYADEEYKPGWFDRYYDAIEMKSSREFIVPENLTKYVWL